MSTEFRKNAVLAVIALVVLLIGTASGNAFVMLGISLASLILIGLLSKKQIGIRVIFIVAVAAITAAFTAFVMAM